MSRPEPAAFAESVASRIRQARYAQGLSLRDVETKSGGAIKATHLGSYERGTRAVTPERLEQLAEFFGIPLQELLFGPPQRTVQVPPLVLSLEALRLAPATAYWLRRWVDLIRGMRGDWAGHLLTVRADDVHALSAVYDTTPEVLLDTLRAWSVLESEPITEATPEAVTATGVA